VKEKKSSEREKLKVEEVVWLSFLETIQQSRGGFASHLTALLGLLL
jgi:hypothetical protein